MVESYVWSKESIMNLSTDTIVEYEGDVSLSNSTLVLNGLSSAKFSYAFNTTDKVLQSNELGIDLIVENDNIEANSRYGEDIQVELYIQYYDDVLDDNGQIAGYIIGGRDTYQLHPYFRHEVDGYTSRLEIEIYNKKIANIDVLFINSSEDRVEFKNIQMFNSITVMDAISMYGGSGAGGGGDTPAPPLIDGITLYSTSGSYTIDVMGGELILETLLSDDLILQYAGGTNGRQVELTWLITCLSGAENIGRTQYTISQRVENGVDYALFYGRQVFKALGNGVYNVRVEITNNPTIYTEKNITILNNNITDIEMTILSDNGKLNSDTITNCTLKLLPENNKTQANSHDDIKVTISSYDGNGLAYIWEPSQNYKYSNRNYKVSGGVVNLQLVGAYNGKVKVTVEFINNVNIQYNILYPAGFIKEFIIDVVGIPVSNYVYIDIPAGNVINDSMDRLQVYVKCDSERIYKGGTNGSTYGVESVDGLGSAVVTVDTNDGYANTISYSIIPLTPGKIRFWTNTVTYSGKVVYYIAEEIDIESIKNIPETIIETNTGMFEIASGGGQLEVYPRPNYDWSGDWSFSQATIDGGSVTIQDKGVYALVTADKNGRLNFICTPAKGKPISCELSISNQYPESVTLTTGAGSSEENFKVGVGSTLTIYVEPEQIVNNTHNRYNFLVDKIDSNVNVNMSMSTNYCVITGRQVGKFRLNISRYVDNKFLTSVIIEVV